MLSKKTKTSCKIELIFEKEYDRTHFVFTEKSIKKAWWERTGYWATILKPEIKNWLKQSDIMYGYRDGVLFLKNPADVLMFKLRWR